MPVFEGIREAITSWEETVQTAEDTQERMTREEIVQTVEGLQVIPDPYAFSSISAVMNATESQAAITRNDIEEALYNMQEAGGRPDYLVISPQDLNLLRAYAQREGLQHPSLVQMERDGSYNIMGMDVITSRHTSRPLILEDPTRQEQLLVNSTHDYPQPISAPSIVGVAYGGGGIRGREADVMIVDDIHSTPVPVHPDGETKGGM